MANENDQDKRYYRSLARNMALIMIIVSTIPLVLISAVTRHYFQVSYREKVLNYAKLQITKHRESIDNFLTDRLDALRTLAGSHSIEQLITEDFLRSSLSLLQAEYGGSIVDLTMVDDTGTQIAYAGPYKQEHADYSKAAWFHNASQQDHYVSDVFYGFRDLPHLALTVRREHEGKKYVARATIDFESFKRLVDTIGSDVTGLAYVVNRDGELQTPARSAAKLSKDDYVKFFADKPESPPDVKIIERADTSGKDYVDLMTLINNGAWVLVHHQSADEMYADLYAARDSTILVFLIGIVAIVISSLVLSNRTARRIAHEAHEKRAINEQLIETGKLAALGELAAGVAHEVNNPLGMMLQEAGWMQDLLEEEDIRSWPTLDEFTRSLSRLQTQGRRCKEITHKLLSFARKTDPTIKKAQLNDLIQEVVDLSEQRARYSNVKINTNLEEELPTVSISTSEVQQVLLNMINNSLDAIGNKGGIINVTSRLDDNYAVVEVSDNGPGIAQADLTRIFEPFFTTKPVGKGTGLGLSICYGIVKRMGGEIKVESEVGVGTTFHIYFPLPGHKSATI
ncbi:MAG TPA: ATP-binding protein [Desulfomonilaceae bacterium]|nr:ATP-binding protein [Desulfomonilaceae bacterium]